MLYIDLILTVPSSVPPSLPPSPARPAVRGSGVRRAPAHGRPMRNDGADPLPRVEGPGGGGRESHAAEVRRPYAGKKEEGGGRGRGG